MKSIDNLFMLDPATGLATEDIKTGCEWVVQGQGQATKKHDGICSLFHKGTLWKRRVLPVRRPVGDDVQVALAYMAGIGVIEWEGSTHTEPFVGLKPIPADLWACGPVVWNEDETGEVPCWLKVHISEPENVHFAEAMSVQGSSLVNGRTYELCGPKVNKNPEKLDAHTLIPHGNHVMVNAPRLFTEFKEWFEEHDCEGIVFWSEDGRMARVKRKQFGLAWPV